MTLTFNSSARIAFLSDTHLNAHMPRTFTAWQTTLQQLSHTATAVFLLGDVFDAWVGDDSLEHDSFARDCAQVLRATTQHCPVYVVRGNRDFLLGEQFATASACQLLPDVAVLQLGAQPIVLVHGDAQCVSDTRYQQFRAQSRQAAWQAAVLAKSYAERCALVAQFRAVEGRLPGATQPAAGEAYIDCDPDTLCSLLHQHQAQHIVHGHTHQPQDASISPASATQPPAKPLWRHVLSDWDLDHGPHARAEVLWLEMDDGGELIWRRESVD